MEDGTLQISIGTTALSVISLNFHKQTGLLIFIFFDRENMQQLGVSLLTAIF